MLARRAVSSRAHGATIAGWRPAVPLNERQARFVAEYLVNLNATQAAVRAGYSARTAYSAAELAHLVSWLGNDNITNNTKNILISAKGLGELGDMSEMLGRLIAR